MNLIVNANPKPTTRSVGSTLAHRLAKNLGGRTEVIRVYEGEQGYFNFDYNPVWIDRVMVAEHIIIPTPMWNFSIPAALKDFLDKIAQQGKLWDIDKDGNLIGLLKDRPVYIIMTSGGHYQEGAADDFVVPYLRAYFAFTGIRNVLDFRVGGVFDSAGRVRDKEFIDRTAAEMFRTFALNSDL